MRKFTEKWRFTGLEIPGNRLKQHEKTGSNRKNEAISGNSRKYKPVSEFGTKRPRVRIPPLRHNNPGFPLWASRVIAIRNAGERTRGRRGKRGKRQPGGLSGEAGSAPSLLARKGERNPLQGFRATIERTVSNPATSTPGSVDFPTLPGFCFLYPVSVFFRVATPRVAKVQKVHFFPAKFGPSEIFRKFPVSVNQIVHARQKSCRKQLDTV